MTVKILMSKWSHRRFIDKAKNQYPGGHLRVTVHTDRPDAEVDVLHAQPCAVSTVCLFVSPVWWASTVVGLNKNRWPRTDNGVLVERIRDTVNVLERSTREKNRSAYFGFNCVLLKLFCWNSLRCCCRDLPGLHRPHESRSHESSCWNFRSAQRSWPFGRRGTGTINQSSWFYLFCGTERYKNCVFNSITCIQLRRILCVVFLSVSVAYRALTSCGWTESLTRMCVTSRFPTTSTQVHPLIVSEFVDRCKRKWA